MPNNGLNEATILLSLCSFWKQFQNNLELNQDIYIIWSWIFFHASKVFFSMANNKTYGKYFGRGNLSLWHYVRSIESEKLFLGRPDSRTRVTHMHLYWGKCSLKEGTKMSPFSGLGFLGIPTNTFLSLRHTLLGCS